MTRAIPALARAFSSEVGTCSREEDASQHKTAARLTRAWSLRALLAAACLAFASRGRAEPASARGPEAIADVAEKVIDAVVNISTSQTVEAKDAPSGGDRKSTMPKLPPGSPFEEFFDDFKNHHGGVDKGLDLTPHKTVSLSSGLILA